MGYIKHHAIVVTGSRWRHPDPLGTPMSERSREIDEAHAAAKDFGCIVSEIVEGAMNDTFSFLVAPDGSKEGWEDSDLGDQARNRFVQWLNKANGQHGGWFEWAEVWYGNDDGDAGIVRHQDTHIEAGIP